MSHFVTYVLVPDGVEDIEKAVAALLAPYNENNSVPEYTERCYCVGSEARRRAREATEQKFGTMDDLRKAYAESETRKMAFTEFKLNHPEADEGLFSSSVEGREAWSQVYRPRMEFEQKMFAKDHGKETPESDCTDCKGSGEVQTDYNPDSKWDWWVIGGRWDGSIQGLNLNKGASWERVFSEEARRLNNNIRKIDDAFLKELRSHPQELTPFAVLTPDGDWHEKGEMGWFAMVSNEKDKGSWVEEVVELLAKYKESWAVGCDLHI